MVRPAFHVGRSRAADFTLAGSCLVATGGPMAGSARGGGGGGGAACLGVGAWGFAWISAVFTRSIFDATSASLSGVGSLAALLRHSSQVPRA